MVYGFQQPCSTALRGELYYTWVTGITAYSEAEGAVRACLAVSIDVQTTVLLIIKKSVVDWFRRIMAYNHLSLGPATPSTLDQSITIT